MQNMRYVDVRDIAVSADAEDAELLGMFRGQQQADRMAIIAGESTVWILPKAALWAKARSMELEREQRNREAELAGQQKERRARACQERREMARAKQRKRREEGIRRAMGILAAGIVAGCAAALHSRTGDAGQLLTVIGAVLLASSAAQLLWKREGRG